MADTLKIGGKKFVSIKIAVKQCSYSRDYITKLAREGKISAQQISRLWYIDPASLKNYSELTKQEKQIRKKHLSEERRQERELRESIEKKKTERSKQAKWQKLKVPATAIAVVTLGLITGVGLQQIPDVAESLSQQVASAPIVHQLMGEPNKKFTKEDILLEEIFTDYQNAQIAEFSSESVRMATFAESDQGILLLPQTGNESGNVVTEEMFSDQVLVTTNEDGQTYAVPVDNNGRITGEEIPFVIVPVEHGS